MNPADQLVEHELMLNRFNRLMGELQRGTLSRNIFQPWEIELLLDLEACRLPPKHVPDILRRYQKAVTRQLETTPGPPMTLSRYLEIAKAIHNARRPSAG